MNTRLRKLLLGDQPYIPLRSKYKRIVLTSQLSIITIVITAIFFVLDAALPDSLYSLPFLLINGTFAIISLFLNRIGKHTAAKILLALSVNFSIFLFSEREPLEIGLYLFFLVTNVGTIAAFGYEEKYLAIGFISLSVILFSISLFTDLTFLPKVTGSPDYVIFNIFVNFILSFAACSMIIYFLINLNYRSEKAISENEQQMILKNEELTKLNAELDKFTYSTSHDLRSPISSVLGLIQLARMTDDANEIKSYIGMMEERLASLNKFIKDIADYSRNTRTEIKMEPVALHKTISEIVEQLKFYPGAEKIRVTLKIDPSFLLYTDSTRFQIIFSNLISNSFKYVDKNKEQSFVRVAAEFDGHYYQFRIEDNGVGIADKYLPKIFEMFFQAHEKSEGSGLGLYIVKEAVGKLNGTITAKSKLAVGSLFEVALPNNELAPTVVG